MNAIEATATDRRGLTAFDQSHAQVVDLAMDRELRNLRTVLPQSGDQRRLTVAFTHYWQAEQNELRLIAGGDRRAAEAFAGRNTDPAFAEFVALIEDALRHNDAIADRANSLADAGTAGILLAGMGAVCVLFRRYAQVLRASTEARLAAQETLRRGHQRFAALAASASDVIAITSPEGEIQYVTPNAQRLWGHASDALLHSPVSSLVHPEDAGRLQAMLVQAAGAGESLTTGMGESLTTEVRLHNAWGDDCVSEVVLTNLLSEPAVAGLVMTWRDVTERKAFEAQLTHQAFHDTLTGLPNRTLLLERLQQALARSRRTRAPVALLFLDLDNFKAVNDGLGHDAGDALLVSVAQRLQACVRPGDTVARLGGDEFTILLENLADEDEATGVAERVVATLGAPVIVAGHELSVTGSLGSAISHGDERTSDDLLRDADTAMYQAKMGGKAHCVVFDHSMNTHALERFALEEELRAALDRGELRLHYQPIMFLGSGGVSEVEALVRWEHPTRGLIAPDKFIPLAEETGLIVPLGQWVLTEACRQAREWHALYPKRPPLTVSVNLSGRQLQQPDLVENVAGFWPRRGCLRTTSSLRSRRRS